MGYKRVLNKKEVEFLESYAKSAKGDIMAGEIRKDILPQLKLVNGNIDRNMNLVYMRLKSIRKRIARETKEPSPAKLDLAAVRKVLGDIRAIARVMGKPEGYLAPLEDLMAENVRLVEELKEMARGGKGTEQLQKENEKLRKFLIPAKILLRETAGLRAQASVLTERIKVIKEKNGTDLTAFLEELDESHILEDKK